MIVVATKMDAAQDPARVESLEALARERGLPFFKISSVTGEGLPVLEARHGGRGAGPRYRGQRWSHFRVISSITSSGRVVCSQNT